MFRQIALASLLAVSALACGPGQHEVGKDPADSGSQTTPCDNTSCGADFCDSDGQCRKYCGPNYPNAVCPTGTVCHSYVCRPPCSANNPCPLREACVNGACERNGDACINGQTCAISGQVCVQGFCHSRCGTPFPNNICPSGSQCLNSVCQ